MGMHPEAGQWEKPGPVVVMRPPYIGTSRTSHWYSGSSGTAASPLAGCQ